MRLPAFPNVQSEGKDRWIRRGKVVTPLVYFTPRAADRHTEKRSPLDDVQARPRGNISNFLPTNWNKGEETKRDYRTL